MRQNPAKKEREAFPQQGEQTERGNHPVDGSLERFCGPQRQSVCGIITAGDASCPHKPLIVIK